MGLLYDQFYSILPGIYQKSDSSTFSKYLLYNPTTPTYASSIYLLSGIRKREGGSEP